MLPILGLFLVALIEIGLAVGVLLRNPRRPVNRWFAAYTGALATWAILNGTFRLLGDAQATLVVARMTFAAAALIPVTFFRFAVVFPRPGGTRTDLVQAVTWAGLFICGLAFSPWIVAGVRVGPGASQPLYGPLHLVFGLYFVTCYGWALVHLVRKLGQTKGFARAQLQYLFLGTGLACLGGVTTNLLIPLVLQTSRFSLYGPYFTLILVGFAAHSIIRHRLMDIRVVISRSVAYATGWLVTSVLVIGGGILFSRWALQSDPSPGVDLVLGLVASLAFLALAPRMRQMSDRYLYRPAYDARQLVREGSRAMNTFAGARQVASAMGGLLSRALQVERLAIILGRPDQLGWEPVFTQQVDPGAGWPESLAPAAPLVEELRLRPGALVRDDLASRPPSRQVAAIAQDLRGWGAEVAVPVRGEGELIAVLLVGPKLSGDPFYQDDFDLLETLASQLAIGLANAQLYQEVVSIKEYNERILTHMDSGVVAVREDGVVTTFNPAAERITGLPAGSCLGRSLGALDPAMQHILKDSLAGQQDAETEITVSHADGHTLPLLIHTSSLHDRQGHVRGAISVFTDHSRLKALEEDKRRTDRLAAMGALARGIAHEVRNPLVAIKTFAELLPERADDQEFRSTFAKVAVKEIHRIEALLGRLRALAVPAAAQLARVDLAVPVRETLELLRGEADRRRIRIVTDIERDLPPVLGEPDQLKQLFLNLCLNGLEAMGTAGTLAVTVRADRERPGSEVITVRVADTGPGIPPEELARVFEPFFTTKAHGTGLGLAICRGIADAHRARLWAEPGQAGVGVVFGVQLPALAATPAPAAPLTMEAAR